MPGKIDIALQSVFTPSFVNYYAKDKFPGIFTPINYLQNLLFALECIIWGGLKQQLHISSCIPI